MTETPEPIAVIGAGSWGSALANVLARGGHRVRLWARTPARAATITSSHANPPYHDGPLSPDIAVTADLATALAGAEIVILAIPSQAMRVTVEAAAAHLGSEAIVVSAAKGFELETGATMTEVISATLSSRLPVIAMSGPNIAAEIAGGLPAATVVACADPGAAARVRDVCNGPQLRFYSGDDVIGVEYGGALKNVIAIAAGICDGIGIGDNGKAAIITRGLAEMTRLGVGAGANPLTFAGLTGVGDCVVTCMSSHSRNRGLGDAIGRGANADAYAASTPMVIEGVNATRAAVSLAERYGVDVPIARQVHAVLFEEKKVEDALMDLMGRGPGDELRGLGLTATEGG